MAGKAYARYFEFFQPKLRCFGISIGGAHCSFLFEQFFLFRFSCSVFDRTDANPTALGCRSYVTELLAETQPLNGTPGQQSLPIVCRQLIDRW